MLTKKSIHYFLPNEPVCPSFCLPVCLYIRLSIRMCLSICPCINPSLCFWLYVNLSVCFSVCLSVFQSFNLSVFFVCLSFHSLFPLHPVGLSIHLSVYLSVHTFVYLLILPSKRVCVFICTCISPYLYLVNLSVPSAVSICLLVCLNAKIIPFAYFYTL
jgi:hypothetical protein